MSDSQTHRITAAFLRCTLPNLEWTHKAHLSVGLWHLLNFSPSQAMRRLRDGIRRYNIACNIPNTDTSGYHETITQFYVAIIIHFLKTQDESQPIDQLASALLKDYGDRSLLSSYYSQKRLMSKEARQFWVSPDLNPNPTEGDLFCQNPF